jgi:hypothetical protein
MKINAVYDREGRILAASVSGGDYDGPTPVPGEDEQAATLEVPDAFAKSTLEEVCLGLRVDPNSNSLVAETRAQG